MRRKVVLAFLLVVACAALWLLAAEGPTDADAPRGPVRGTSAEARARVATAPVAATPPDAPPPARSHDEAELVPEEEDGFVVVGEEIDGERVRAEYAARPLDARLRWWRKEAARPPSRGGTLSFSTAEDDLPVTLPPVTGVVRSRADGAPVRGANVTWARRPSSNPPATRTDGEGRFTLERISGDDPYGLSCVLVVSAPGLAPLSCFPGVAPALELWLDRPGAIEVTYPAGTPLTLRAAAFDPELQRLLDDAAPDAPPVRERDDDPDEPDDAPEGPDEPDDERGEEVAVHWAELPLPPGEYDLVGPTTCVRVTVRAGETTRVRLEEPGARALRLTVLDPDRRPLSLEQDELFGGIVLRLESAAPRRYVVRVQTDHRGRVELSSRGGPYRVVAVLGQVPWQPELPESVDAEVDLGHVPGEGDHTLVLPRLARFKLSRRDESEPWPVLLCLERDHRCRAGTSPVQEGGVEPIALRGLAAQGVAHPGRYEVVGGGEVELPTIAEYPDRGPPRYVDIRWRPGVELGPEQAVRGRAWLRPEGRDVAGVTYPSTLDLPPRDGWMCEPDGGFAFWSDGQGRIAGDPSLGGFGGRRRAFFAPGRYVLEGWSDLGPFRVEVDLPAPGGLDVDLSPR